MYTILVKQINPKEEIQIVLKRYLEKIVLYFYVRRDRKKLRKENKQYNKNRLLSLMKKRKPKNTKHGIATNGNVTEEENASDNNL
jgi:hypothetical protein